MNTKRLLTIEDLYNFYANGSKSVHFNCKENDGLPIVVQSSGKLKFDKTNDATEGLLPVVLQSCHTGVNDNTSKIESNVMKNALSSFSNRPILGYIHEVDGVPQFYTHNMHEDEDGNVVYDEIPVGIIPESCDAKLEYDEDKGKEYVVVNGYIFEEYSKAAEILKREKECFVSVELSVRELSYNAKEKCLVIEDFYFSGVTILGQDEDGNVVNPGMAGSNIKLVDFSKENNSLFNDKYEQHMMEIQRKLDTIISGFNIKNSMKGGVSMKHFEELLKRYGKTAEEIEFDYESMSEEELDAKFAELFEEVVDTETVVESEETEIDEISSDDEESVESEEPDPEVDNTFRRVYELSHDDIRCALYNLLIPYEESDNTYYYISEVFDDYFVYESYYNGGKIYGQAYVKDDETVSFKDERYELFKELLTASEKAELEAMRSNYSEMYQKLKTYENNEMEAKKVELLYSEDYASLKDNKEFKSLIEEHSDMTFEELQNACDKILLSAVKSGNFSFSASEKEMNMKKTSMKQFTNPTATKNKKPSRYGNLFKKKEDN